MPKQTYLTRYSLIIKRLEKAPATFQQLSDHLQKEFELLDLPFSFSIRTLQRDIKDIEANFSIEIANEQKGERRYYIVEKPDTRQHAERLLNAYELVNILSTSQSFADVVLLEQRKPDGLQHFHGLLYAIQNKKILSFSHFKYWDDTITQRKVHPLALKESQGRWYLVAVDTKDQKLKTFGLDRIQDLQISKTTFREQYNHNVKEIFHNAFGIINESNDGGGPQDVLLSFTVEQGNYIKSYPLHHSQEVVSETEDEVLIKLRLAVTHDFMMELLKYGPALTIRMPKYFGRELMNMAQQVVKKYC